MLWAFIGILVGIFIGLLFNVPIPQEYTRYTAVIIIAISDALIGAIRAEVTNEKFDSYVFLGGLITNVIFAFVVTYLGEHLGVNLYLAVMIVFTFRIFQNLSLVRTTLIEKWKKRVRVSSHKK